MDHMEITCLDSTMSCIIEARQRELTELESSEKRLIEELEQEVSKGSLLKKKCDDYSAKINLRKISVAEAMKKVEDTILSDILEERDDLNADIILYEDKLNRLKTQKEEELTQLRKTLEELEYCENFDETNESTLDIEAVALMDEEDKLKEDLRVLSTELEGKEIILTKLHEKVTSLEEEMVEAKLQLSKQQQILKEKKVLLQEAYEERARLQSLVKQPLKESNNQGSLFSEVNDKVSVIADKYEVLKKKYIKAKDVLSANNAEINRLKSESLKYKNFEERMKNEQLELAKEMRILLRKRKEDLAGTLELLRKKAEESGEVQPTVISSRNVSDVNIFAKAAQVEVERAQREISTISMNKIILEQRVYRCSGELARAKQQLKDKIEMNDELERQIKSYEDKEQTRESQVEPTRKIRFAEDIKYIDGN